MIKIERVGSLYAVRATPPHVQEAWVSASPLPMRALVNELQLRGAHQTDIGDALYEVDPDWIQTETLPGGLTVCRQSALAATSKCPIMGREPAGIRAGST